MRLFIGLVFLFFSTALYSQLDHPKASPAATVTQEVGFTTIGIDYSRPAARGRKIFGDLVPYGRIWRVGANASTKITVDFEIQVMGNKLPVGTYALYAFPEEDEWEIVFHKNITYWGDGRKEYNAEEDVFRIALKPEESSAYHENFLIAFDSITHDSASLNLYWAHTKISIPMTVNTHELMEQKIEERLSHQAKPQTYYEAARYYVEQDINHETALVYLKNAIELGGDTYYFHRVKSLSEAELGDYKAAIKSAEKSLELAEKQGKDEFVRMNQKNIDLWKASLEK